MSKEFDLQNVMAEAIQRAQSVGFVFTVKEDQEKDIYEIYEAALDYLANRKFSDQEKFNCEASASSVTELSYFLPIKGAQHVSGELEVTYDDDGKAVVHHEVWDADGKLYIIAVTVG